MKTFLMAVVLSSLAGIGYAAPLPTDTLANILAIPGGTGTIAGTTFAFNEPRGGFPEFFSGPWANGSYWGTANNITFTPDATNANNPGFTLTGNFTSTFRQFNEIILGDYSVTAPVGKKIVGVSYDIGSLVGSDSNNYVWGSCYASMGSPSSTCSFSPGSNSITDSLDLRFWNTATTSGPVGYGSATIHYIEAPITSAVPEPESYAMLLAGLGLMGFTVRRKNNA